MSYRIPIGSYRIFRVYLTGVLEYILQDPDRSFAGFLEYILQDPNRIWQDF